MRCTGIARSTGRQCGRSALVGSRFCRYHEGERTTGRRGDGEKDRRSGAVTRRRGDAATGKGSRVEEATQSFYADVLEEGALELEVAAALRGVEDEIAVLRMLIRKVAREGDVEATRKGIETLCRALKVQYALEGRSADGLAGSLARVLDEVGNELGMAL